MELSTILIVCVATINSTAVYISRSLTSLVILAQYERPFAYNYTSWTYPLLQPYTHWLIVFSIISQISFKVSLVPLPKQQFYRRHNMNEHSNYLIPFTCVALQPYVVLGFCDNFAPLYSTAQICSLRGHLPLLCSNLLDIRVTWKSHSVV